MSVLFVTVCSFFYTVVLSGNQHMLAISLTTIRLKTLRQKPDTLLPAGGKVHLYRPLAIYFPCSAESRPL